MKKFIKRFLMLFALLVLIVSGTAQTIIRDRANEDIQDRRYSISWGRRFYPEAKRLFKTSWLPPRNPDYWFSWGKLGNEFEGNLRKKREYKSGVSKMPGRVKIINYGILTEMTKHSEKLRDYMDSIQKINGKELAYLTPGGIIGGITELTEPLWVLYFKNKLKGIDKLPNDGNFKKLGFNDKEVELLERINVKEDVKMKIENIKSDLRISKNAFMPRGKRILLWHKVLEDYRGFMRELDALKSRAKNQIYIEEWMKETMSKPSKPEMQTDSLIMKNLFERYKNKL